MDRDIDREFRAPDDSVQFFSAFAGLACVIPLCIFMVLLNYLTAVSMAALLILEIIFLTAAFAFNSAEVIVNANKNKLTVRNFACGNVASVKEYKYSDIEAADCFVSQNISRNGVNVSYSMQAVIMLKNGKTLHYIMKLKIALNLHKHDPKLYNKLVENEEMLKLCAFINEIKAKQNNDGNMQ